MKPRRPLWPLGLFAYALAAAKLGLIAYEEDAHPLLSGAGTSLVERRYPCRFSVTRGRCWKKAHDCCWRRKR